ncbi:hypothetical protein EVA_13878 [gut metagenome]|uniref:Uncharacterized protein n=1 Tax=gut metagenome TaxID=749906 RepID=J9FSS8_9ZZZZ
MRLCAEMPMISGRSMTWTPRVAQRSTAKRWSPLRR